MLYTGIDLHRRLLVLCTLNEQGTIVARSRIKNDPIAVTTYFRQWSDSHRAVVECTSNWYWLCDLLRSHNIEVVLSHAKYLKAIAYAKVKTDAVDAHTLAQLLRMDFIPEAHQLPPEYRAMRDLLRQRMVMEHKRTTLMQHMTSMLVKFNILQYPVAPSAPKFADFLADCPIPDQYRMTLLMYHQQCLQVSDHKRQLEQYFKQELRPTPTLQLLVSIPGIGDITGAIIAMETGQISRFANDKHYASYCRLAPGARDSGGKHKHRSGSKDGNQYLKYAFTEAAIKSMQFYPQIKQFALHLEERSNASIARTVVAKELSKIAYFVLSRQQTFTTFKGIEIRKSRDWPRTCKPVRLTGGQTVVGASPLA